MDRRAFVSGVTLGLLTAPLAGEGQQAERIYRIGFLSTRSSSMLGLPLTAFKQKLRDLDYVEGRNLVIECTIARPARRVINLCLLCEGPWGDGRPPQPPSFLLPERPPSDPISKTIK